MSPGLPLISRFGKQSYQSTRSQEFTSNDRKAHIGASEISSQFSDLTCRPPLPGITVSDGYPRRSRVRSGYNQRSSFNDCPLGENQPRGQTSKVIPEYSLLGSTRCKGVSWWSANSNK